MALNPNFTATDVRTLRDTSLDLCSSGALGVSSDLFNFFKSEIDTAVEAHATNSAFIDLQFTTETPQALLDTITPDSNQLEIAMQAVERDLVRRGFQADAYPGDGASIMWIIQWGQN